MKFLLQYYNVFGGILLGFLIYDLKFLAAIFFHPLAGLFALIGLILIFVTPFLFKYKSIFPLRGNVKSVYYFYLFWSIVIIIRPLFESTGYSENSIHPYVIFGVTSYLLPFFVLLGTGIISLPKLFKITYIFALIGFIYFVLDFKNMQAIVASGIRIGSEDSDAIGINDLANRYGIYFNISFFSLLSYEFISRKQKWLAISATVLMFFLLLYFARRNGIVMAFGYFTATFYLYLLQSNGATKFLKAIFLLLILVTVSLTVFMYSDTTFSLLFNRIDEDTRSGVDESLIRYLNSENAWFFGKGIEGVYTHPDFDNPRYTHETGYLYMILKGGVIYLSLYVFLLLHSAYLGFFKTNNRLTKAFAIYLFIHVLLLIPFGLISFGLEYFFVWVAVAFCQFNNYRLMTNQQMKYYLSITQ